MSGAEIMTALGRRIPITLLCDLVDPAGPQSGHIYGQEPADDAWLRGLAYAGGFRAAGGPSA